MTTRDPTDDFRQHEGDDAPGADPAPAPWWAGLPALVLVALGCWIGFKLVELAAPYLANVKACLP